MDVANAVAIALLVSMCAAFAALYLVSHAKANALEEKLKAALADNKELEEAGRQYVEAAKYQLNKLAEYHDDKSARNEDQLQQMRIILNRTISEALTRQPVTTKLLQGEPPK